MPNYKLILEYEGTNYHGWQRQKAKITVQEIIEKSLGKIFHKEIRITGQGRIDSGAHALAQTANFKTEKDFNVSNLKKALNSLLPKDIRIKDIQVAADSFHARYSARTRHYRYIIYQGSNTSVWLRRFAYFYPYTINIKKMKEAAQYLMGKHDFSAFQSTGSPVKNPIRTVKLIEINNGKLNFLNEVPAIIFDIKADAFLYRMVRNIVGTLLGVGEGKIQPLEIKKFLEGKKKRRGRTVPANGLYLVGVEY
jgi:tRNA pseudouridine38-40 synthase